MSVFTKDPDELLDYQIDWHDSLVYGETIDTSTWVVPSGLTAGAATSTGTTATQWLSGGTDGTTYVVINRITTTSARVKERSFTLVVSGSLVQVGTSATSLITRALRLLGVVDAVDTPAAEDLAIGKVALDAFTDSLGLERAAIYAIARTVQPLVAGTQTYTIGTGGVFNQVRPMWIDAFSVRPDRTASPVLELPRGTPLTIEAWQAVPVKTTTALYPTDLYYDHTWTAGLGVITVYPVPTTSVCDLVLYTPTAAGRFVDLTTLYTLPPGWERMYHFNLAREMAPDFGAPVPDFVNQVAVQSLAVIKRANYRPVDLRLDPAMPGMRGGGRFSLYEGA